MHYFAIKPANFCENQTYQCVGNYPCGYFTNQYEDIVQSARGYQEIDIPNKKIS